MQILLLILASLFCLILIFSDKDNWKSKQTIFILDISSTMNTQDVSDIPGKEISRLDIAKKLIEKTINLNTGGDYWLIIFASKADYFIPPTNDFVTLLQYLSWINSNFLSWWSKKNFDSVLDLISTNDSNSKIILLSDSDNLIQNYWKIYSILIPSKLKSTKDLNSIAKKINSEGFILSNSQFNSSILFLWIIIILAI